MDDEIDEIVVPSLGQYKEKDFKAVNRSGADEDLKTDEDKKKEETVKPLMEKIKEVLGDRVKDVVASARLSDSPSCIVTDDNDPTLQMQQMMKAMGQTDLPEVKPILEVNPDHEIVRKLQDSEDKDLLSDVSFLLLEEAMLAEGMMLKKPAEFVQRLNRIMGRAL
jgi:molecular chaperone HtpG